MKSRSLLLFGLLTLLVCSCRGGKTPDSGSNSGNISSSNISGDSWNLSSSGGSSAGQSSASSGQSTSSESTSSSDSSTSGSSETSVESISLNEHELLMVKDDIESLVVNFYPSTESLDEKDGVWASSDETVASVRYGTVKALKKGTTVISYTTTLGSLKAYCTVRVVNSKSEIKREYVKVSDVDSIKVGDELIFACPDFGVAASINRNNRYLLPVNATFSDGGNKLATFGEDAGSYYVGEGPGESFTLENQNNEYLTGKKTTVDTSLYFIPSEKGQINWIFENSGGKDYCVNYDIEDDYWLMFNKISDSDIRFNLYDSNETALMKLPTIYRLEITEIS